jgi:site-specific recombinase XerD
VNLTKAAAITACVRALARQGRSRATIVVVQNTAKAFLADIAKPVRHVELADVRAHLAALHARGLADATIAATLVRVRIFFETLVDEGLIEHDPTEGLNMKPPGRRPQLVLSEAEVQRLLAAAGREEPSPHENSDLARAFALRDRALLELLYSAGVRALEASEARLSDLAFKEGSILVRSVKRGEYRRVPLPKATLAAVREYLDRGRPVFASRGVKVSERLLLSKQGGPVAPTEVWRIVQRVAGRAGVEAHPHAFRRALATHLVRGGVSVEAVRQILGHKELETTAIYVEVDREDLRRAVDTLDSTGK